MATSPSPTSLDPSSPQEEVTTSSSSEDVSTKPLNQAIRIFARIRPSKLMNSRVSLDQPTPGEEGEPQLHFTIPKNEQQGQINNTREHFGFRFDRVFDAQVSQEEIFDHVAKESIDSVLDGFNATIFAYGQTGSGKTFTITGGAERYADRGLIPRSIQYIFKKIKNNPARNYQCFVSYLEIYNEVGFDLLDESRDVKKLEDLPKVSLREDEEQHIYIQNLSLRPVVNEEEALNWLFVGDTNKMIAETPSNPSSSRSHCIFILTLVSQTQASDTILRSKLHLVDLAGSERVAKTGIDGTLLKEAKYINLSLHYLEQVIVALHEKALGKRHHIPYRNSMMTSILRDSLGGNCRTTMVATLSTEQHLLDESISTCRFAQRVALISNRVSINEELDPQLLIAKLKKQIVELKAELAIARGETSDSPLPEYELEKCRQAVLLYMQGDTDALLFSDFRKLQFCFQVFKDLASKPSSTVVKDSNEVKQLKKQLQQRDTEIGVLIPMVNKYKAKVKQLQESSTASWNESVSSSSSSFSLESSANTTLVSTSSLEEVSSKSSATMKSSSCETADQTALTSKPVDKMALLEAFKQQYPAMSVIEEQKEVLKLKYIEAKKLGAEASETRNYIKHLKEVLSQKRTSNESLSLSNPTLAFPTEFLKEEQELRNEIASLTETYKQKYSNLKALKVEIEHMQHLLEKAKVKLNVDFEAWLNQFSGPPTPSTSASPVPTTTTTENVKIKNPEVVSDIQAFYAARNKLVP